VRFVAEPGARGHGGAGTRLALLSVALLKETTMPPIPDDGRRRPRPTTPRKRRRGDLAEQVARILEHNFGGRQWFLSRERTEALVRGLATSRPASREAALALTPLQLWVLRGAVLVAPLDLMEDWKGQQKIVRLLDARLQELGVSAEEEDEEE
jgi:hypothetical protein